MLLLAPFKKIIMTKTTNEAFFWKYSCKTNLMTTYGRDLRATLRTCTIIVWTNMVSSRPSNSLRSSARRHRFCRRNSILECWVLYRWSNYSFLTLSYLKHWFVLKNFAIKFVWMKYNYRMLIVNCIQLWMIHFPAYIRFRFSMFLVVKLMIFLIY